MPDKLNLRMVRARLSMALLELTLMPEPARLRECRQCTGLFLHHGRGHGRKWCRMVTCDNRVKVEPFRRKT